MADANHILPHNDELNEQLMKLVNGNLSDEEAQLIEKQMDDDAFVKDALDGLQQFSSGKKLDDYVRSLNQSLQQQLAIKKEKRWKRKLQQPAWILLAAVIILLLCVLAYVVVLFARNS